MDAADLDYRARTLTGCIPPHLVSRLVELGHTEEVEFQAGRDEDWDFFRMRLPLMVACGLREEAIRQARAHPEGDTWYAAWSIAELLADAGRTEEAVAVLEQQGSRNSGLLAWHLIDLGRVKDAVALLHADGEKATGQPFSDHDGSPYRSSVTLMIVLPGAPLEGECGGRL